MVKKLYDVEEDFEARITILTEEEGGRKTPPVNGIRWDFLYAQDDPADGIYMIWPDFFGDDGSSFSTDTRLEGTLHARMHIARKEGIAAWHQNRLLEDTEFYCVEGSTKVAKGVVTKLTGIKKHYDE
jgi:hypothetical protein